MFRAIVDSSMLTLRNRVILAGAVAVIAASSLRGQPFEMEWVTVDCGGGSYSTNANFELGGTFGQPDAGPRMMGGAFELAGGFWPAFTAAVCQLPGDMNLDGRRDGRDVQMFVNCFLDNGSNCTCADMDQSEVLTPVDIGSFTNMLLAQ